MLNGCSRYSRGDEVDIGGYNRENARPFDLISGSVVDGL